MKQTNKQKRQTWTLAIYFIVLFTTLVYFGWNCYMEYPTLDKLEAFMLGVLMLVFVPLYMLLETDIFISIRYFLSNSETKKIGLTIIHTLCLFISCYISAACTLFLIFHPSNNKDGYMHPVPYLLGVLILLRIGYWCFIIFKRQQKQNRSVDNPPMLDKQKT